MSTPDPDLGPRVYAEISAVLAAAARRGKRAAKAAANPAEVGLPGPREDLATPPERAALGRAARADCPRSMLGEYQSRQDSQTAIELLAAQERDRIQALLPVRHERMRESPFAFYRGSAVVMASDLARHPRTGLEAQLCGDAHLLNFGLYAPPDRLTVFDINDFDETNPGPFEWDLHRLLASLVLAGEDKGMGRQATRAAVLSAALQYLASMRKYAGQPNLDTWYERRTLADLAGYVREHHRPDLAAAIAAATKESERKSMWSAVNRFTTLDSEGRVFRNEPPILDRLPMDGSIRAAVEAMYERYKATLPPARRVLLDRYRITDMGHKVVGVGSVGLLAFVTLLQGRDDNDLIVLQSKEAVASVLEAHTAPAPYASHGERVVTGQQILQPASDAFLGWYDGNSGRQYYTRQMRDHKGSLDLRTLTPGVLAAYGALCAATLARGHARSGDPVAIAAYLGEGDKAADAFTRFAFAYRDQVHADYDAWKQAH